MSKRRVREIEKQITGAGLSCNSVVVTGGGHYQATVEGNGQEKKFFFSKTPSDHRADRNKMAMVKRWLGAVLLSVSS